jgi:hypothetical protein
MDTKFGKVAICISGLIRTGIPAYRSFEKFFQDLEADIFFHTWHDTDRVPRIVDLYQPKNYCVSQPFVRNPKTNSDGQGAWGNMLYGMMMANELKKEYEIANGFRYDLVIKTRFDLVFHPNCCFNHRPKIQPRTIYCPGGNNGFNHTDYESHGINDIMFWGDGESMDIATNVYQYYRHRALKTSDKITRGILVDPGDLYFSAGNLIYSRIINRNIAVVKYVPNIREIPWREDVSHLDPIIDYDKITERYRQS